MANTTCFVGLPQDYKRIGELAKKFNLDEKVVFFKCQAWASQNNTVTFPTDEQFENYLKEQNAPKMSVKVGTPPTVQINPAQDYNNISGVTLNGEQQEAFNKAIEWYNSDDKDYFVIDGKAGTGKTTVAKQIIEAIGTSSSRPFIIAGAISHKASKNIGVPISKKARQLRINFQFASVAKMLGLKLDRDTNKFKKDPNPNAMNIAKTADLIIVDECSMITEDHFKELMKSKGPNTKVLFLGDIGQLPGIEDEDKNKDSKFFVPKAGKDFIGFSKTKNIAHLRTRMRQGEESPILPFADIFWNNTVNTPNSDAPGQVVVKDIIQKEGALLAAKSMEAIQQQLLDAYKEAIETGNFNYIKTVCYTNAVRQKTNSLIHNTLLGDKENKETGYSEGDFIIFNDTFTVDDVPVVTNSEEGVVLKQGNVEHDQFGVPYFYMTIQLDGNTVTVPVVTKTGRAKYKAALDSLTKKAKAFGDKKTPERGRAWRDVYDYEKLYADIDFGYAITSHKSQGSTYTISVVDLENIYGTTALHTKTKSQSAYTAITRASKVALIVTPYAQRNTVQNINSVAEALEGYNQVQSVESINQSINNAEVIENNNPEPNTAINIYAGTNENADLSNFAKRPFNIEDLSFESVEQGFQFGKFDILKQVINNGYTERNAAYKNIIEQINNIQQKILDTKRSDFTSDVAYGAELRKLGKTRLKASDSDLQMIIDNFFAKEKVNGFANWEKDKTASNVMKKLLSESFRHNYQALQKLVATGNTPLTHTQDRSKWNTEFPRLLMEVRDELKKDLEDLEELKKFGNNLSPSVLEFSSRSEMLNTMIQNADAFAGEVSNSPYRKDGDKFVLKQETEVQKAIKYISNRGIPKSRINELLSEEDVKYLTEGKDQTKYYNIGYTSGDPSIIAVTNRELYDYGYTPKKIMFLREEGRYNESVVSTNISQFKKDSTFLVDGNDTKAIEFFEKNGYKYEVYSVKQTLNSNKQQNKNAISPLVITQANQTASKAKEIGGIDTLRHPDNNGMHFGNPFSHSNYPGVQKVVPTVKDAVIAFEQWLRGNAYQDIEPERRQWILDQINSGKLDNKPLVYYTDKVPDNSYGRSTYDYYDAPNHAHILQKLVNEHKQQGIIGKATEKKTIDISRLQHTPEGHTSNEGIDSLLKVKLAFSAEKRADRAAMMAEDFKNFAEQLVDDKLDELRKEISRVNSWRGKKSEEEKQKRLYRLIGQRNAYSGSEGILQFLKDYGLYPVIKAMKEEYESLRDNAQAEEDFYVATEYQKILDNFNELFKDACSVLEDRERISIDFDPTKVEQSVVTESRQDEQTIEDRDFSDQDDNSRATGNDGWSFRIKNLDPYSLLSKRVKQFLSTIMMCDSEGDPVTDDLGRVKYIDAAHAHTVLMNCTQEVTTSKEFAYKDAEGWHFPVLEEKGIKYPWINNVVDTLKDTEDDSFIASFYSDLRQDFIHYSQQVYLKDKGMVGTKDCNKITELESTLDEVKENYDQGILLDDNSIYDKNKSINIENAKKGMEYCKQLTQLIEDGAAKNEGTITALLSKCIKMIGLSPNTSILTGLIRLEENTENEIFPVTDLVSYLSSIFTKASTTVGEVDIIGEYEGYFKDIANLIGTIQDGRAITSFRVMSDTYYSYSAPSFLNTMIKNLKNEKKYKQYIENEFGYDSWFKNQEGLRDGWLKMLNDSSELGQELRKNLDITHELTITHNGEELKYDSWTPSHIRVGFFRRYWSVPHNAKSSYQYAWYPLPILADAPVCIFMKFVKFEDYEKALIPKIVEVIMQELDRMQRVKQRKEKGVQPIQNYDIEEGKPSRGSKFCFFPELNDPDYLDEIFKYVKRGDIAGLKEWLGESVVPTLMNNLWESSQEELSDDDVRSMARVLINEKVLSEDSITPDMGVDDIKEMIAPYTKEYIWNSVYATSQIIQLTVTDLAFYKNATDFQKRYKEIYASGRKLFTEAMFNGQKIGKDIRKTVYIKDSIITSSRFNNIRAALDSAVKNGNIQSFDRDAILNKFKDINVADAQAYIHPNALKSMLGMLGEWNTEMDEALERFQDGTWTMADFNILWQTIKPFMYTQIPTPDGLGGRMKVGHQNKNSEFVLLAAYNLVSNSFSASPQLRGIQRFMEENDIDIIQMESAVKTGGQGIININYSQTKLNRFISKASKVYGKASFIPKLMELAKVNDVEKLKDFKTFKKAMDAALDKEIISQKRYNDIMNSILPSESQVINILENLTKIQKDETDRAADGEYGFKEDGSPRTVGDFKATVVHELPYNDLVIQQPTKEHLFDAKSIFGSQFRNLIVSDLPDNISIDIRGKKFNKKEITDTFWFLQIQNLMEDFRQLEQDLGSIEKVQEVLIKSVESSDKLNKDIIDALQIVTVKDALGNEKKVFNIPPNNPNTTLKLQEVVTSLFLNRVTKQYIKGGACFLVSDFGLTKELEIEYNDDNSIRGIQCYMPANSKKFYEPFMKKNEQGQLELDINDIPEELRRGIGYRIPTEDKYSMAPLIIKGFLPQQNGSSIMLPADITQLAGSDFDIDKLYLMLPEFDIKEYDTEKAKEYYIDNVLSEEERQKLAENEKSDVTKTKKYNEWYNKNKDDFKYEKPIIEKIEYDVTKGITEQTGNSDERRAKRNNMLIDLSFKILTAKGMEDKIFSPGNFDELKLEASIADIVSNPEAIDKFMEYYKIKDRKELVKVISEAQNNKDSKKVISNFKDDNPEFFSETSNPLTVNTFVYNHVQNTTGGKLIGIYAINGSMHAKYQHTQIALKEEYAFKINNQVYQSLHDLVDKKGNRISSNNAQFQAASVDNVKDPVLAKLMQNEDTAFVACFMVRAGIPISDIVMFFSQPYIRNYIKSGAPITEIGVAVEKLCEKYEIYPKNSLTSVTSEDLIESALNVNARDLTKEEANDLLQKRINVLSLFSHIVFLADELNNITRVSRMDSPNGGISNTLSGVQAQLDAVRYIEDNSLDSPFTGMESVVKPNYITADMSNKKILDLLHQKELPLLQAFYSFGVEMSQSVLKYFPQVNDWSNNTINTIMKNSPEYYHKNVKVAQKAIETFYKSALEFELSHTKLFGDDNQATFEEKRKYYTKKFPEEFRAFKRSVKKDPALEPLRRFTVLNKLIVKDGKIIIPKSARQRRRSSDLLRREMETLLAMGGQASVIAQKLFLYSFYAEGFWFGPETINNIFGTGFLMQFPEYVETLRNMNISMQDGTYWDRFLPQFYANNPEHARLVYRLFSRDKFGKKVPDIEFDGISAYVPVEKVQTIRNGKMDVFDYIRISKSKGSSPKLYKLNSIPSSDTLEYVEVPILNSHKYNANATVEEMKAYDPVKPKPSSNSLADNLLKDIKSQSPQTQATPQAELPVNIPQFSEEAQEEADRIVDTAGELGTTITQENANKLDDLVNKQNYIPSKEALDFVNGAVKNLQETDNGNNPINDIDTNDTKTVKTDKPMCSPGK